MVEIHIDTSAINEKITQLAGTYPQMQKAFKRSARETVRHAKMFIPKQIAKEYAISAAGVKSSSSSERGAVNVQSRVTSSGVTITYTGRTLTLARFHYSPRKLGTRKMVKAAVMRGKKKPLGRNAFIGPTGAKDESKIQSIPFKRVGDYTVPTKGRYHKVRYKSASREYVQRQPIMPVYTLSVPQMISNKNVEPVVAEELTGYMMTRFLHQYDVIMRGIVKS